MTIDLNEIKVGDDLLYHTGVLSEDRQENAELTKTAQEFFIRSTRKGGTKEFELCQKAVGEKFEYYARRIKPSVRKDAIDIAAYELRLDMNPSEHVKPVLT